MQGGLGFKWLGHAGFFRSDEQPATSNFGTNFFCKGARRRYTGFLTEKPVLRPESGLSQACARSFQSLRSEGRYRVYSWRRRKRHAKFDGLARLCDGSEQPPSDGKIKFISIEGEPFSDCAA